MSESAISLDVDDIKEWRSIVTLIVFVFTSTPVLPQTPRPEPVGANEMG